MPKFRKTTEKNLPSFSTASIPDIVFILLFFFMVSTKLSDKNMKVRIIEPNATEIRKIEKKSLVSHIYIGKPVNSNDNGNATKIQLNDGFVQINDIKELISNEREPKSPDIRSKMFVSISADSQTDMGTVTDVKQELRKASAFKIIYSCKSGTQEQIFDNLK